ncbi:hypothetical protein [Kribbella deserti]|uniref:Uncharacterized protein n=1 Tax=Kribbella deserti TaxID=1926257 RepID=A0ABV6QND9_9ACTN
MAERRAGEDARDAEKVRNNARHRALTRLAAENRARLRQLYLEEFNKAQKEAS